MLDNTSEDNKPNARRQVISAKISGSLFDDIERFRYEQKCSCRNDAIAVLIALGLNVLNRIPEEDMQQYLEHYKISLNAGGTS